jgi:hypothetical protein
MRKSNLKAAPGWVRELTGTPLGYMPVTLYDITDAPHTPAKVKATIKKYASRGMSAPRTAGAASMKEPYHALTFVNFISDTGIAGTMDLRPGRRSPALTRELGRPNPG